MATPHRRLVGLLAASLPFSAASAQPPAQQATAPPPASGFEERLDVNLVNVDVFAFDRKGRPVTGLGREDFQLFEDGRRVEITHFTPVDEPRAAAGRGAREPATAAAAPGVAVEPLYLAVLVDNFNLRPQNRVRVLQPLADDLARRLAPADLVMVASFDQTVRVHQGFTRDRGELAAAFGEVEALPALGVLAETEQRDGILALEGWLLDDDPRCDQYVETYIRQVVLPAKWRTELTLQAVEDFTASLGDLPGRKALLYVTEGLQLRPGGALGLAMADFCGDQAMGLRLEGFDTALALKRLTAVANAARVTLYPLGVAGVGDAQRGGRGGLAQTQDRQSGFEVLSFMGHDTGGVASLDVVDPSPALTPLMEDAGHRYSLAYASPRRDLGEVHRIEVKVKRRGVDLRYRRSFRDPTPEERITRDLLAALWVGGGDNPLGLEVEAAAEPSVEGRGYRVPLRLGIPIDHLTLETLNGERQGRVEVFVTVRGAGGLRTPVETAHLPVHVAEADLAAASEQLYGYDIELTLGEGSHRVAIGVVDELGGVASYLTHDIELAAP